MTHAERRAELPPKSRGDDGDRAQNDQPIGRSLSDGADHTREGKAPTGDRWHIKQRPFSPPVDRDQIEDKAALKKADRLAEQDARYIRRPMSPEEFGEVKVRWQTRQLKRVSSAASVFGARESSKDLLQIMAEFERDSRALKRAIQAKQIPEGCKEEDPASGEEEDYAVQDEEAGAGATHAGAGMSSLENAPVKSTSVRKKMASLFKRVLGRKGTQMKEHPSVLDQLAAKQLQDGVSTI